MLAACWKSGFGSTIVDSIYAAVSSLQRPPIIDDASVGTFQKNCWNSLSIDCNFWKISWKWVKKYLSFSNLRWKKKGINILVALRRKQKKHIWKVSKKKAGNLKRVVHIFVSEILVGNLSSTLNAPSNVLIIDKIFIRYYSEKKGLRFKKLDFWILQ